MEEYKHIKPIKRFIDTLPLCQNTCQHYTVYTFWTVLMLLPILQYYENGVNFLQWDLLLITGMLTFILGLRMIAGIKDRFEYTLSRLLTRKIFIIEAGDKNQLLQHIEENAQNWARIGGLLAALAMIVAFSAALLNNYLWQRALLGVAETLGAYIAGNMLGRMASYGQLAWVLEKESIVIKAKPLHVDGVAGFKPIGDFFFYQAMITAIPAVFLATWWFLFPLWPRDYSHWEQAYLALLIIAILIEILAFIIPVWSFHRIMLREKERWLEKADGLSNDISELQFLSESDLPSETKNSSPEKIEALKKHYWLIENMTTWPVDINTKKRFRFNNLLLFIPLFGDIAKRSLDWKHIMAIVKQFGA